MANLTFTANLDGFTDLGQPQGGTMFWNGGIAGQGVFQDGVFGDTFTADFTLTNGAWTINSLFVVSGGESTTNITDGDADFGRVIDYLNLGNNSDIDLINSEITHIVGFGSGTHDINLGSAFTRSIYIGGSQTDIVVNAGGAGLIDIYDGVANLTINGEVGNINTSNAADTLTVFGEVGLADLGGGNNVVGVQGYVAALGVDADDDDITVDADGRIELLVSEGGDDTIDLNLNARIGKLIQNDGTLLVETEDNARLEFADTNGTDITLSVADSSRIENFVSSGGNVTANVTGSGRIDRLRVDDGNGMITMTGQARVRELQLFEGTHTVVSDERFITGIDLYESSSTITIGTGGAGYIRSFVDTAQTHTFNFNGFVESVVIGSMQTANVTIGANGSGHIKLRDGADVVTTGTGGVTMIETRDGNDTVNVGDGNVDILYAGTGNDVITVTGSNANVDKIAGGADNNSLSIDAGRVTSVRMDDGDDTLVLTNGGRINQLRDFGGTNTLTLTGDSRIDQAVLDGDNTIVLNDDSRIFQLKVDRGHLDLTTGTGFVESIVGFDMSSDITINGGLGQLIFFADTAKSHTITINDFTNQISITDSFSDETDNQSTNLTVNSGLNFAQLGNGNDTVTTGNTFVGVINTRKGDDSVVVGDGGIELVATRDGNDTITTNGGYIDLIQAGVDDDEVNIGSGGGGFIKTSGGEDSVTTTTGYVDVISTGDDNDTVEVGTGGAGAVFGGSGDDMIILNDMDPTAGLTVYGGQGEDTISFENITINVTFSMMQPGLYQNIGAKDASLDRDAVIGYVQESRVEHIIGSDGSDVLTGDNVNNNILGGVGNDRLVGGGGDDFIVGGDNRDIIIGDEGKDRLEGSKGDDTIDGGTGNDILRGGRGNDVFVFGENGGGDRIRDYEHGLDRLQISDHVGGFGTLVIADQGPHLRVEYDGGVIFLLSQAGLTLASGDFDFIA